MTKPVTCVQDTDSKDSISTESAVGITLDGKTNSQNIDKSVVGDLVSQLIEKSTKKGKTVIKIEIEISHE